MNPLVIWRVLDKKGYGLLLFVSFVFIFFIVLSAGFAEALYALPEKIVYPEKTITPYYIILSSYSLAPFTSIFSSSKVVRELQNINGVKRTVYELFTIIEYKSNMYIARGVENRDLSIVLGDYHIYGEEFSDYCIGCVWIGKSLAEKLGLKINDKIIVFSPLSSSSNVLVVKGIIETSSYARYEFITNLATARILRGTCSDCVSNIIVFLDSRDSLQELYRVFNVPSTERGLLEKALLAIRFSGRHISFETYESLSSMYLSRIGLTREVLYAFMIALIILLSLGFHIIGSSLVLFNTDKFVILYEQGLPMRTIKLVTTFYSLLVIMLGGLTASVVSSTLSPTVKFYFLGYMLNPLINHAYSIVSIITLSVMVITGIWSVRVLEE